MSRNETIFAIATPARRCALHLQRISGGDVFIKLTPFLRRPRSNRSMAPEEWTPLDVSPRSTHLTLVDLDGSPIDDVMITAYRGPRSFNGEDIAEISSHGSPIILAQLQSLFRAIGFRDAAPGEFTLRAMLNGKLDLVQAEAIHELIMSHTRAGSRLAHNAGCGSISRRVQDLRNQMVATLAYLEAHIDFDESDVGTWNSDEIAANLRRLRIDVQALEDSYRSGLKAREGVRVALVGVPNSGKSSLFNAILGKSRAIVTEIPGTTRDVLEDALRLGDREYVFLDTAGLREATDRVEQMGIELTLNSMREADVICLLCDLSQRDSQCDLPSFVEQNLTLLSPAHSSRTASAAVILLFSKCDLMPQPLQTIPGMKELIGSLKERGIETVSTSRSHFDELTAALETVYDRLVHHVDSTESAVLVSERQHNKARQARMALEQSEMDARNNEYPEKIASLANAAKRALEELVGEITSEEVLNRLFAGFCIGK